MEATAMATMGGANFFDEEWDYSSLGKIFFTEEDASSSSAAAKDLMLQFFHGEDDDDATAAAAALFTNGCHDDTIFWPVINNQNVAGAGAGADGTTNLMCSDTFLDYNNFDNIVVSQESSSGSEGYFFPNQLPDFDVNHLITDGSMDLSCPLMIGIQENNYLENSETDSHLQNAINVVVVADVESKMQPKKRKFESTSDDVGPTNNIGTECSEIPNNKKNNKKTRVARNAQKNKKNVEPIKSRKNRNNKKEKQIIVNSKEEEEEEEEEEENTVGGQNIIGQSSSSCYSSEDDSNADDKTSGPALNLNGKTRATRGAATDPQSLYARKRRERINERLRILQNLIPNGTKVDISTMLEEAVHYVKFLQLQIKLLSSDDMWMYAPIVYNGLDIGQFGKIFPTL